MTQTKGIMEWWNIGRRPYREGGRIDRRKANRRPSQIWYPISPHHSNLPIFQHSSLKLQASLRRSTPPLRVAHTAARFGVCFVTLLAGVAQAGEWELAWSEEFNTKGLPDKTKWGYEEGFVRNEEKQYYTRERKENVRVADGVLVIEGRKETFKNPKHKPGSKNWKEQAVANYTAGSINTLGKVEFKYGRIEVRAKVPQGKGMWPAIWMKGANCREINWPKCGEIDIMEYVGKDPDTIYANNHFANPEIKDKAVHKMGGGGKINIKEPYNDFHIYAIEWTEKEIKFFVDDKQYATFNIDMAGKGPDNPFRKPHFLLLNLAMGGSWGGPIDDTLFPRKYEIDYVRYYKSKTIGR